MNKDFYKPLSTSVQVEDFIKYSPIWKDMRNEMDLWLNEIHQRLENLDGELSSRVLDRLGGSAEAIRNLENFPQVLLQNVTATCRKVKINDSKS